jgi:hypothetical protein
MAFALLLVILPVPFLATGFIAQTTTTGTIEGIVTDSNGAISGSRTPSACAGYQG